MAALGITEAAADPAVHETSEEGGGRVPGEWAEGACHPRHSTRTHAEGGAADEGEGRDTLRPADGERLRDATAKTVSNNHGVRDAEVVHQRANGIGVSAAVGRGRRWIASTEAGEVNNDETMSGKKIAGDGVPEPRGSRESVDEHHGITGSATPRRVVIESGTADIDELTSHPGNLALFARNGIL